MILMFNETEFKMVYDIALHDMLAIRRHRPTESGELNLRFIDVENWARAAEVDLQTAVNIVACGLANDFTNDTLTYGFTYTMVHDLQHIFWSESNFKEPSLFWDLFLAFDHSDTAGDGLAAAELAERGVKALFENVRFPRWRTGQS